jgi:hypothetical protein
MNKLAFGFVIALCVSSLGCGGGGAAAPSGDGSGNGNAASSGGAAPASDSFYRITNNSNYDIHYIYISPTSQSTWGPDQLGSNQILHAGESLTLTGVACDSYDLKLVDEDGDECVQQGVQICQNTTLFIENDDLLRCEGYQ